jgi:hypothetical protein
MTVISAASSIDAPTSTGTPIATTTTTAMTKTEADLAAVEEYYEDMGLQMDDYGDIGNSRAHRATRSGTKVERRVAVTGGIAICDVSYRPGSRMRLYSRPLQRQRWGETQVLPRVNWVRNVIEYTHPRM